MRNKLIDHVPAAQESDKEVFKTDKLFHSVLPEGRKLLMGNTVYLKFGPMLKKFCDDDLTFEQKGWNGAMEHYPDGIPRRSVGYTVVKCKGIIILAEGESHLSGGKYDDELTQDATLKGAFQKKRLWTENDKRGGDHTADADDEEAMASASASSSPNAPGVEAEQDEQDPIRIPSTATVSETPTGSAAGRGPRSLATPRKKQSPWEQYHTTPRNSGVRPEDVILSPTASGTEMHFRGAGTLQRAQVRVFGEKLAAEGAAAVILGFDANSKTHMEYVHWVQLGECLSCCEV